jgi:rod shape-determining protein MreC
MRVIWGKKRFDVYKNKLIIVLLVVIISFFVFRHCVRAGGAVVETISSCALYPLLRVQQLIIVSAARWSEQRATLQGLEQYVTDLQKINEQLVAENVMLKSKHLYLQETDEVRAFTQRYAVRNGHTAQVLVRHFSPNNQFFLVDAGSSSGIKKDMVALYCASIVGKVVEVYPWYCKVCLVTDADCKVAAACGIKGVSGIHEGINDMQQTIVRYTSHLDRVDVGDMVLSSGEGLVFPKGFALGKVVSADKGELFYTIAVEPALDLQKLRYCTLVARDDI